MFSMRVEVPRGLFLLLNMLSVHNNIVKLKHYCPYLALSS